MTTISFPINHSYRARRRTRAKSSKLVILVASIITILVTLYAKNLVQSLFIATVEPVEAKTAAVSPITTQIASPSAAVALKKDKRSEILRKFLEEKASPLAENATYFIEIADQYGLDWTLMPSISGMESNFGKAMPSSTNNPFGLGGKKFMSFASIEKAIEYEGKLLSKHYRKSANRAIGAKCCPQSECNQKWAEIVTNFSEEILN